MYMFVFEVFTVYVICSHATCKGEGVFLTRVVPSSLRCASLCAYTTRCGSYTWDAATRSCHLHTKGDTGTETMPHAKYLKESQRMVYRDHQCEGNEVCVPVEAWIKFTRVASTAASAATTTPSITPTLTTTKSRFPPAITTTTTLSATTARTPSATTATTTTTTAPSTTPSATTTTTTSPPPTTTTTTTTLTPRTTATTNPPSPTTATGTPSPATTTIPSDTTTTTQSHTTTTTTPSPATTTTTPSPSTTITIPSPTTIPTTHPTTTTTTRCPTTVNQANVPYTYVGCYTDDKSRVLPHGEMVDRTYMTTETCKLHCHRMNYIYFGTEMKSLATTTIPSDTTTTTQSHTTTTTTPSPATTTTTPSPSTTITIPSPTTIPTTHPTTTTTTRCPTTVNQANVPYTYVGCYTDDKSRVLPHGEMVDRTYMTTETCKLHCHRMNYIYFGTEMKSLATTTIPSDTTTTTQSHTTTTTTPSPATTTTTPSPSTTITIPSPTTIPTTHPTTTTTTRCPTTVNQANVPYTYVGCYTDDKSRVLPHGEMVDRTYMTTETCKLHCHRMNYIYFGTEARYYCFCGNGIKGGYKKKPDSECNVPCPGDRSTMCGGQHWRISIYQIV